MRRKLNVWTLLATIMLLGIIMPAAAQVPTGWQKMTGPPRNYSGTADGIAGDRENSYAWSMEILDKYLYVGTSRNVVGSMLGRFISTTDWPESVPTATDSRGRIYRMKLSTGAWELFYLAPPLVAGPPIFGPDMGYRMMKTFTTRQSGSVLYVGTMGAGCRLLAITPRSTEPTTVFNLTIPVQLPLGFSIRAITEHGGQLFWASDLLNLSTQSTNAAIWYSSDPLREVAQNPSVAFPRIDVPADWFPRGAEIMDMLSYNGSLYVFFLNHDFTPSKLGFWVAKLTRTNGNWTWKLIVGDLAKGAKYPPGLGDPMNAGITSPIVFNNQVYAGTATATMVTLLATGQLNTFGNDVSTIGSRIYRFNQRDVWSNVVPPPLAKNGLLNGFMNPLNQYMWRFGVTRGRLFVGTFDTRILIDQFADQMNIEVPTLINPAGFDLYSTTNGNSWFPESVNGFNDKFNYGGRSFVTDPRTGDLYLGTANPFYGCQIWRLRGMFAY